MSSQLGRHLVLALTVNNSEPSRCILSPAGYRIFSAYAVNNGRTK